MVTNIYLAEGRCLTTRVDESTSHSLGDYVNYKGQRYVITEIEEREHIDYLSVVRINYLSERSKEADIDRVGEDIGD